MSDISSVGHTPGIPGVPGTAGSGPVGYVNRNGSIPHAPGESPAGERAARSDKVELSEHARWLDSLRRLPPIRTEKVQDIRQAIASGSYETPEKLDAAIEMLLDDLEG